MRQLERARETAALYISITAAFVLWFVMFIRSPANFWLLMTGSTSFLAAISLFLKYPPFRRQEFSGRNIITGILSACALYLIFMAGNWISGWIIPMKNEELAIIYGKKDMLAAWQIALLLFFPIGFGEEMFWRGFVQRVASERYGGRNGFLFTLFFYTAAHLCTMNIMLIGAAFIAGLFWGLLYWRLKSLVPCLISHMLWDPLVMIIAPIL
jgi:membrane protease YdiL (CAAX protease family)